MVGIGHDVISLYAWQGDLSFRNVEGRIDIENLSNLKDKQCINIKTVLSCISCKKRITKKYQIDK